MEGIRPLLLLLLSAVADIDSDHRAALGRSESARYADHRGFEALF